MYINNPLEQFSIEVDHTNHSVTWSYTSIGKFIIFNFILLVCSAHNTKNIFLPNKAEKIILFLFSFVRNSVSNSLSVKKCSFILLIYTVFLYIFFSNLVGMIPYSSTSTSHFILTLFLALAFFLGNNLIALCIHQEQYFNLFLPPGVPVLIIPGLILIEYVSYLSRVFSLSIRLFANMMSGHILLKILISFTWAVILAKAIYLSLIILPLCIVLMVIFLEMVIAFLQAYVFMTLISIYLNDVVNIH